MAGGFDDAGLRRMHDVLTDHVERGELPGLIALVAHGDDVYVDVIGEKTFGDTEPMPRDAIFRIASLTKPIGAAAAMVLLETGAFRLDDPVTELLPELADRRVLRSIEAELDDTVPAKRAITVEDVLTYRLGFGAVMAPPGTYPIQVAEAELDLKTLGPPWPPTPHTPDEWIRRFATLPLLHQPGEEWMYNTGGQVLGVLLERAAGKPLETFLRERLFDPLGMHDTAFSVPPQHRDRFTTSYKPDPETSVCSVLDGVDDSWWSTLPAFPNAAGWLVSTIDDFWAFTQMLRSGGVHRGERILSEKSVELMTTDHLTREQRDRNTLFLGGHGWGFGMQAPSAGTIETTGLAGYGWDGGTGTTWRTNAGRDLTTILFTQRAMTSPEPPAIFVDFVGAAYRAIAG